MEQKKKIIQV